MADAAKKLEVVRATPDGSKPLPLEWWKAPSTIGHRTDQLLKTGGIWSDNVGTTAYIQSMTLYPGGTVIVELRKGYMPGMLDSEQNYVTEWGVVFGGHGLVKL